MSKKIQIFGFAPSTYTQTARMVCEEVGATHELLPLDFKKPSHFELHPHGKMPILKRGSVHLYETLAIVSYVDDVFGRGKLQPTEPEAKARMFQAVSAACDVGYDDLVSALHSDEPGGEALAAAGVQLKLFDKVLTDWTWIAGDRLTLADFFAYPMVEFAVSKIGTSALDGLPHLSQWRDEMSARPSVQKAA